ncbi:MAG TPA: trypsin-like peptidase domain-containing protein [Pseudomonadales bacterium]
MKAAHTILLGLLFGAIAGWLVILRPASGPQMVSFADAVSIAAPAVVNIYTTKTSSTINDSDNPLLGFFQGQQQQRLQQKRELSLGSGVIVHEQGFILTNYHVIRDAEEILVLLSDGRDALARVIGVDRDSDLAVLRIQLAGLTAIRPARASQLRVGDPVLAIGNPYGFGQTVTAGIVSAIGRYGLNLNTYENFIQTDAAINVGSSGGALVNHRGELVGINSAMYSQNGASQGIGLAIPVDIAAKVMTDIIRYGQVVRGWLGLEVAQLNHNLAQRLGIHQTSGLIITRIHRNGPAEQAGLLPGDIIISIADKQIDSGQEGLLEVANLPPGKTINLEIIRDNQTRLLPLTVGIRPASNS